MEGQQRANAAQLATRTIKQPKGRQRKMPLKSNGNVQQSMQFGGSGGLFGGIAPPTSSFDFSAPGGISFPSTSFGNGNTSGNSFSSPDISENEADARADTTGEELLRRNRGFQTPSNQPALFHAPNAFGGTQSSNPNPFGQPSAQQKPTDNLFSFKPTTSQPPPQPVFNFSSTNTANTQSSPFTFPSSTPKETVPSTIDFNSTGAEDNKPANNPFSFLSSQPASSAPSFSSTAQLGQDKPVNNIFGGIAQPAAPSPVFNFGSPAPQDKPAPSNTPFVFGQSSTKTSSASIDSVPAPAADKPSNNLFGAPQQAPASAGSAFSFGQQPTTQPNIFANAKFPPSPASSLFGNQKPVQNTSDIFGGQDQQQNGNGAASTSDGSRPKFGAAEEPVSQSTPPANIFANFGKPATTTSTLFESSNKQTTPARNLFAGLNGQTTSGPDLFGTLNKPVQQSLAQLDSNRSLANGTDEPKDLTSGTTGASNLSVFNQAASSNFNLSSTSLIHTPVPSMPASTAGTPAMSFGAANAPSTALAASNYGGETLFSLNKPIDTPKSVHQPAHDVIFPEGSERDQNLPDAQPTSATVSNGVDSSNAPNVDKSHLYREMAAAARITEEFMRPLVPAKFNEEQRKEFYVAYRMRCLNKAMQGFFTTLAMGSEISKAIGYYQEQRVVIMGDKLDWSSKNGVQTGQDQDSEKSNQNRTTHTQPTKGQVVEKPKMLPDNGSQPFSSDIAPSKLSYPASSGPTSLNVAASSSPARGKRKAEVQLTKDDDEREELEGRRMKNPRSVAAPTGGSNTSNIFKNILASPAAASPEKKVETLPATYQDDKPRFNPFSNLPLPSSSAAPTTSATPSTANVSAPKPATETSTLFGSKVSSSASTINTTVSTQAPIKPPTFGTGPVNFMAQFSQQASKSEEKLMEEAKAEDMDSDEDEAEWESRWREKRKSELKTIEALGKSKRATFTGGKFTFGQAEALKTDAPISDSASPEKSDDSSQPPSKPLFGLTPGENSTRSMSSSATGSRTPTPGIAGSNTGSVLDGHMSGKPVSFGQNIFGHLSDADSGADSQKDGNHDSDSADEETENEEDSENKDPSYQPGSEQSSSRTSPEDAGQGIIPTKKPLFESGASKSAGHLGATSTSGTSTPGGSLFDRITRDSSGNPIRQISSDEKENTQPSSTTNVANTTNPFARSFDGTPADQTWKPNSPIKFGPPTVNVTAATPTKQATPFANLFGNSGSSEPSSSAGGSPKPTSGLFAGLNTSKPSITGGVGFNFGSGLSTTTSSLFPSAAVSATTSRATSPGGTTDGDSAAEADPDTEHHEQINLTAGGPGEEDEEVLHEVRAKALQWSSTGDTPWQTKGVGPLRVLKHKETGATRILLRADPRGTIVLNKSLLAGVKYEVTEKTIKFPAAGEPGKGLETWLLQLKTPAFAQELGKVMEENKPSS